MDSHTRRVGKYELQALLGQGGMAEVWKGLDTQLQRHVAIKMLHPNLHATPDFVTRFEREARMVASLRHPNILKIYDFHISQPPETPNMVAYMVMEYIEGQTLADYIDITSRVGRFPAAIDIVKLFTSISAAIDYAHQRGMIHRDIKPANILLDRRSASRYPVGEPILSDFGIAKLLGATSSTVSSGFLGTPLYISPEQALGAPGSESSDIYSLAVILYEICAGRLPFQAESASAVMMQHINVLPPSPALTNPHIPPALEAVIMRGLAKDPTFRFPNASTLTASLAKAFDIPVPELLKLSGDVVDIMNARTYIPPMQFESTAMSRSTEISPKNNAIKVSPNGSLSAQTPNISISTTPSFAKSLPSASSALAEAPQTPIPPLFDVAAPQTPIPPLFDAAAPLTFISPPSLPPVRKQKRKRQVLLSSVLLFIILLGAGIGDFYLHFYPEPAPAPPNPILVGHAYFISSGQFQFTNSNGLNDNLQIHMQNIPAPATGKTYYIWLLGDRCQTTQAVHGATNVLTCSITPTSTVIPLGVLPVVHGNADFHYSGDQQHSNLIANFSRLLVTEEDSKHMPQSPSLDQHTWRYYAEIPQAFNGKKNALYDIRLLLWEGKAPIGKVTGYSLSDLGIQGGADINLFKNTQKVSEWADSARDNFQSQNMVSFDFIKRQVTRVLDYLDGVDFVSKDVPLNTSILTDQKLAKVPLINLNNDQLNKGYVARINNTLGDLQNFPDITPDMRTRCQAALKALTNVEHWLENVRTDAKTLEYLPYSQMFLPHTQSLLDDMATNALYAFIGQLNPSIDTIDEGVIQIHYDIQHLADFEIKAYQLKN